MTTAALIVAASAVATLLNTILIALALGPLRSIARVLIRVEAEERAASPAHADPAFNVDDIPARYRAPKT